ncbi:hypothetical protein B0T26DRAFT_739877 [Lasiosphaeria miniovina]|uniref:LPXTG-motif cell wall anchor domain protein n=1 Tax=Lasiosphaeria miniovina TaxID=1954250 RepID=A0AA40E3J0_9PEZI|nr:uncharacterized protein B0T26DRAFT_739877 [Lasiosphaeria miniovina]KAK0722751.1 hypothetical protein B0T26DRAFT_739877 [Lasiosphaeria miniovina]
MTSSSFAPEAGHGPSNTGITAHCTSSGSSTSGPSVSISTAKTNANSNNLAFRSDGNVFHAHRQNHNSSKLPAFRFADLKKDAIVLPSLLQHIPPSPVSPQPAHDSTLSSPGSPDRHDGTSLQTQRDAHDQNQRIPGSSFPSEGASQNHNYQNRFRSGAQILPDNNPVSFETPQSAASFPQHTHSHNLTHSTHAQASPSPPRTRASTFQSPSATQTSLDGRSAASRRPASFPDSPTVAGTASAYTTSAQSSSSSATPAAKRRLLTAASAANGAEPLVSPRPTLSSSRPHTVESTDTEHPAENSTEEWAQGQRELLLPKTVETAKSDERRKSRPPVSYRPPPSVVTALGGRAVIPPIRAFRSSGSRKSLVLDMHTRRVSEESFGDDITDPNQRDRTLRALEGRPDDDYSQITPPDSANAMHDNDNDTDNTADIFMRIAREDSSRRAPEEQEMAEDQSAISRITRTTHRRPLSAAVPTYQATSPPQITRRLSDQRENSRGRNLSSSQSAQQITRQLTYRATVTDRTTSNTTAPEDSGRAAQPLRTPLRPSPITPRQISFQEPSPATETSTSYSRRRQSITESNSGHTSTRTPQYRAVNFNLGQSRTYNSSPLVPKSIDVQKHEPQSSEANHGVEGTESSTSTAAPSTVWDELDDLKSRIHRLELTGKAPSTSGAAMSRASDDRPPTATTNATTMSASPKRGSGLGGTAPVDVVSTTSSQREAQPLLLSALSKIEGVTSLEVLAAIKSAATDAIALSSMVGVPGQPGPIYSGASTIGVGGGASVTDRQLRRKADSICKSLTELCIALADENGQVKRPRSAHATREAEPMASPISSRLAPVINQRRPSALITESTAPKATVTSPRAPTSLEQRRMTMLTTVALPSPRYAGAPSTPIDQAGAGRKSSLLLARTRRAGTEEPEEASGRKSSLHLRTRRAGTEELEENREGRKTSLLLRSRKGTNDDEDESRFRAPSRATTEVNSFRSTARDFSQQALSPQDSNPLASSALPRRRLVPSSLNPRLVAPSPAAVPARRYLDRPTPERETNSVAEKLAEDRGQRQFSLSQTAMLNRTGSLNRRPRDSSIPSIPSPSTQGGGYR